MRRVAVILSVLALVMSSCTKNKENPFEYDESKNLYSGAFAVSSDYFAEITVNCNTGEITVLINGRKTPIELPPDYRNVFETQHCFYTEDFNRDGYVDFRLRPNCDARYSQSYDYYFDKEKEYFVPVVDEEGGNTIIEDIDEEEAYTNSDDSECREINFKRECRYKGKTLSAVYEKVYIQDKEDLQKYMKFSLPSNDLGYEMIYSEGEKANDSISVRYHYNEENSLTVSFLTEYGGQYYFFREDGNDTVFKYDYHD